MSITTRPWKQTDGEPQLGALRRRLESEGMATAWYSEVPGAVFPEHEHAFAESRWVLAGFLQIEAAGETIVLGPGDRADIPARTPHRAQVLGLTPVIYVTGAPPDVFPLPARTAISAA